MSQHVHKYRRVNIGREKEYFVMQCQLPSCPHYTPMKTKLSCPPLVGKISICNRCGDRFVLDRRSLRQAKPICASCVTSPKQREVDKAAKFFASLEKGLLEEADDSI